MGIDYYNCDKCNGIYADCGYYVTCNEEAGGCGSSWCSNECAIDDGYIPHSCKLGNALEEGEACPEGECEHSDNDDCWECEHYTNTSCKHCRGEIVSDEDILEYALTLLNKTKEELISEIKNK